MCLKRVYIVFIRTYEGRKVCKVLRNNDTRYYNTSASSFPVGDV